MNRVLSLRVFAAFRSFSRTQDQSGLEQEFFFPGVRMSKNNPIPAIAPVARWLLLVSDRTRRRQYPPSSWSSRPALIPKVAHPSSSIALAESFWGQGSNDLLRQSPFTIGC
jgi:hypothetical protein